MKLFKMNINLETVVYAENEEKAMEWLDNNCDRVVGGDVTVDNLSLVCEVKEKKDLPSHWEGISIPWGSHTNDTVQQILWEKENV